MGLILQFRLNPSPRGLNHTDHGLPAGVNVHVLDHDLLGALPRWRFSASSNIAKVRESLPAWFKCSCRGPVVLLFKAIA